MNKWRDGLNRSLLNVYFVGFMVSGVIFNWQYAQRHGFFDWLLFGEVVPTVQAIIWPYYAVEYAIEESSGGGQEHASRVQEIPPQDSTSIIATMKSNAWWLSQYKQLNDTLDKAGGILSSSYRTGPGGIGYVNVRLERIGKRGLYVTIDSPPESMQSIDTVRGATQPSKDRIVVYYRDNDLDGMPDDVYSASFGESIFPEKYTADGFTVIRDDVDHVAFLAQWTICLAYCTNKFLHDKESVLQ
ncbi:MAG: hypothetical protein ABIE70_10995 [bacterium]